MKSHGELNELFDQVIRAMGACVRQFQAMAVELSGLWFRGCAHLYLQHHSRLPGSDRTARLRKKRRTVVLRWFDRQMEECQ